MPKKFEYTPIMNKYDVQNVKATFEDFWKHHLIEKHNVEEDTKWEYVNMFLGTIASIFVLLSYFHKTPFPNDKWIIILCTFGYLVFSFIMERIQLYGYENYTSRFILKTNQFKNLNLKNKKDKSVNLNGAYLLLGSTLEVFSNLITVGAKIKLASGKVVEHEEVLSYNKYLTNKGMIVQKKLTEAFDDLISKTIAKIGSN